jgi:hypothetical protein
MKNEASDGKAEPFRTVLRQSRSINPALPGYHWQLETYLIKQ